MRPFKLDFKKRVRNQFFWIALFSFIALTGQVFDIYQVPQGWESWTNAVLVLLTAMGVIIDPTSDGIGDDK